MSNRSVFIIVCLCLFACANHVRAQTVSELTVEVKTANSSRAGTDDSIHLEIGGLQIPLDNPGIDDFERNSLDTFTISLLGRGLDIEWLRQIGTLAVQKTGDSFWGGGWQFEGITISTELSTVPLYENDSINRSMDGGRLDPDRTWRTDLGDAGWNIPEPEPSWPPCTTLPDVDTGGPTLPDKDCDGIPDDADDSIDVPIDTDGDGLPDTWEGQNGQDPLTPNPDLDGDGWSNVKNTRSVLMLTEIEALDEREDIGKDEIYLVAEDVRYPIKLDLNGQWPLNDDDIVRPNIALDVRTVAETVSVSDGFFRTRLRLRESDLTFFEKPTDDTYSVFEVNWPSTLPIVVEHVDDDSHYKMTFESFSVPFSDPTVDDKEGDREGDMLSERLEFLVSHQEATVQAAEVNGYHGLADPMHRELFVEIDTLGGNHGMSYDTKQMVSSQFFYHAISPRIDDGYLDGGEVLPFKETLTLDELRNDYKSDSDIFSPLRRDFYRYGIFVSEIPGGFNGRAEAGGFAGKNFLVSRTTMLGEFSPIALLHEIGHTLSLCHPEVGEGPLTSPICPVGAGWVGCVHYCGVGDKDVTAMGDDKGGDAIVAGAVTGAVIGAGIGFGVGGPIGAVAGGLLGGIAGGVLGLFNSDAYQRTVNFHEKEWSAIQFFRMLVSRP